MNALTLLSQHVVEEALAFFDVGRLLRYWPATGGIENSNYFVRTTHGEYVLTLLERPPYSGSEFFNLMFALDEAGLPVPAPLSDRNGHLDLLIQGKSALLQRRFPGHHVLVPTGNQLAALGRVVARMHLAARPVAKRISPHPRNAQWLTTTADSLRGAISYNTSAVVETSIAAITSVLARDDVRTLPEGVIHGDLFRDNVLFHDESLTGVIDFHHAARGTLIYDLAVIANDWCCDRNGQLNTEKVLSLLKAYHGLRPLTRQEVWFFSPFRLYAATSFWLSRLAAYVQSSRNPGTRTKNPREMERIVRVLLSGFDYFDERIFESTPG